MNNTKHLGTPTMANNHASDISASLEDYLGAIYHLEKVNRVARAKDIADRMEVSRASVTGALRTLSDRKLINYEPYSFITLTEQGRDIAREVQRRHKALLQFFQCVLHLEQDHSEKVACKVEHAMDSLTIDRLIEFLTFLKVCPHTNDALSGSTDEKWQWEKGLAHCPQCLTEAEKPNNN